MVESLTLIDEDGRAILSDVSFTIHRGEVLGIAGVEGNGQAELVESIMGMRKRVRGTVRLGGEDITAWPTRRRREAGIAYIPEDRSRHGLLLEAPLWENRMLGHQTQPPNSKGALIDRKGAKRDTQRIVDEYDVRTPVDRRARLGAVGRQPAEAHRRPGDEQRPERCSSPRTRPAASTSARRPRSGTCCARPGPRGSRCC